MGNAGFPGAECWPLGNGRGVKMRETCVHLTYQFTKYRAVIICDFEKPEIGWFNLLQNPFTFIIKGIQFEIFILGSPMAINTQISKIVVC